MSEPGHTTVDVAARERYCDGNAARRCVGPRHEEATMDRCESCGMPLNEATHGTEVDGTASAVYCLTCYTGGSFAAPDATVGDVRAAAIAALVEQGVPPLTATRLTSSIASLPRWV